MAEKRITPFEQGRRDFYSPAGTVFIHPSERERLAGFRAEAANPTATPGMPLVGHLPSLTAGVKASGCTYPRCGCVVNLHTMAGCAAGVAGTSNDQGENRG